MAELSGPRTVRVAPERLGRWLAGFVERHGEVAYELGDGTGSQLTGRAADGSQVVVSVPFPPLDPADGAPDAPGLVESGGPLPAALVAHAERRRMVGALLVRRGGIAVGVFAGRELVSSRVETRYVQSRTKAGGWSQQRYARRRENQAREVVETAAGLAARYLVPRVGELDALALGGDDGLLRSVLADARIAAPSPYGLAGLPSCGPYPVPDPRLAVLRVFPEQFLGVAIQLREAG